MDALDSIFIDDIMAIIFEYLEIDHTTLLVEYARTKGNGMRLLNGQKINSVCFDNAQIKNSSIDMICTMSTFLKTQIMFCHLNTKYFNTTLNGTCFLDNKHSSIFFQHTQLNDVSFVNEEIKDMTLTNCRILNCAIYGLKVNNLLFNCCDISFNIDRMGKTVNTIGSLEVINSNMVSARIAYATIHNWSISMSQIKRCCVSRTNIASIKIRNTHIDGTTFKNIVIQSGYMDDIKWSVCILKNILFDWIVFTKNIFIGCNIIGCTMVGVCIKHTSFQNTMINVDCNRCAISRTTFQGCVMSGKMLETKINDVLFNYCEINILFTRCQFVRCRFNNMVNRNISFVDCTFDNCSHDGERILTQ
jgi:uncharacterized protein YjbI with pentapeptide repeats